MWFYSLSELRGEEKKILSALPVGSARPNSEEINVITKTGKVRIT